MLDYVRVINLLLLLIIIIIPHDDDNFTHMHLPVRVEIIKFACGVNSPKQSPQSNLMPSVQGFSISGVQKSQRSIDTQ